MFELFDPEADFDVLEGGHLPHWYQAGVSYFVTFRTEDSIPHGILRRWHAERARWLQQHGIVASSATWKAELAELPKNSRKEFHERFSQEYMEYLDRGWGACALRHPKSAKIVSDSLMHFDGERYNMGDFVVMPNHVHLLVCLLGEVGILEQCYSWKKFTAGKINQLLGTSGRFWQEESFDHLVRSPEQFQAIQRYIAANPRNLGEGDFVLRQLVS